MPSSRVWCRWSNWIGCSIGFCIPRAYGVRAYSIRPKGTPAAPAATTNNEICARVLCLGRKRGGILVAEHLVRTWERRQQKFSRVTHAEFACADRPEIRDRKFLPAIVRAR